MTDTLRLRRQFPAWLLAVAVGALGLWLEHRHQFSSGFDLFPGPRGDTRLTAYLCEHWYRVLKGKVAWLSPAMFFPAKGTLGYTDALLLFAPPYALLRTGGLDILTSLAVTVVVFNFLNFIVSFALLFHVFRLRWLSSVAGALFFAFNNPKLAQPDHLQLQSVWLLPVVVGCIILFFRDGPVLSSRRAFSLLTLAGLSLDVQLLTAFYHGWFLIVWLLILLALAIALPQTREFLIATMRRHRQAVLAAGAVTIVGLVPFCIIYLPAVREVGGWPYTEALRYTPQLRLYFLMADGNFVWSGATQRILQIAGEDPDWGQHIGIGLIPTTAWLGLSIFAATRRRQLPFLALTIMSVYLLVLLTIQYHGHSLWHVVYKFVPGATSIRAVSRFMIVAALPMSIAFAFSIQRVQEWAGKRIGLHVVLVVLIVFGAFEQFNSGAEDYYSIRAENRHLQRSRQNCRGTARHFT